jgi:hypothetical protein
MPELRQSIVERLRVIARGPRCYGQGNTAIAGLLKRGLVQETGRAVPRHPYTGQPRREYEITEAGRAVLSEQDAGADPSLRADAVS